MRSRGLYREILEFLRSQISKVSYLTTPLSILTFNSVLFFQITEK